MSTERRACEECGLEACGHCDECGYLAHIVFACPHCKVQVCAPCDEREGHPSPGVCWCQYVGAEP